MPIFLLPFDWIVSLTLHFARSWHKIRPMSLFVFDVDGTLIDEAPDQHAPALISQANKGHALREIAGVLDVPPENVVASGDSENDLKMLRIARHFVQVGSVSHLKDLCKEQVFWSILGVPQWPEQHLEGRI